MLTVFLFIALLILLWYSVTITGRYVVEKRKTREYADLIWWAYDKIKYRRYIRKHYSDSIDYEWRMSQVADEEEKRRWRERWR